MNRVNAKYEVLDTFNDVEVKIPSKNDKHFKFIKSDTIVNMSNEIVGVPDHYRRGDIFNGNFLTRNFYINPRYIGKIITADEVRIVSKTDYYRNKITLIIDIIKKNGAPEKKAKYRLKCGSPSGDYKIPGTKKYVKLEKI